MLSARQSTRLAIKSAPVVFQTLRWLLVIPAFLCGAKLLDTVLTVWQQTPHTHQSLCLFLAGSLISLVFGTQLIAPRRGKLAVTIYASVAASILLLHILFFHC